MSLLDPGMPLNCGLLHMDIDIGDALQGCLDCGNQAVGAPGDGAQKVFPGEVEAPPQVARRQHVIDPGRSLPQVPRRRRRVRQQDDELAFAFHDATAGGIRRSNFIPRRAAANGLEADDLAVFANRRHVGDDPVEATVLAPVFDDTAPGASGMEVRPKIGKGSGG